MKTEWARERCERVARRRRQVMEAVTAMRLSVRVEPSNIQPFKCQHL
jgi:hypothetical protein